MLLANLPYFDGKLAFLAGRWDRVSLRELDLDKGIASPVQIRLVKRLQKRLDILLSGSRLKVGIQQTHDLDSRGPDHGVRRVLAKEGEKPHVRRSWIRHTCSSLLEDVQAAVGSQVHLQTVLLVVLGRLCRLKRLHEERSVVLADESHSYQRIAHLVPQK